ncbi:MAG TPA: hypothetical protein VHJ18_12895 [Streptosporangiaceae bacterium]|jgi:hypothetical protein|nr:hypothetical protein [Streptosporangiaceae bacterium]
MRQYMIALSSAAAILAFGIPAAQAGTGGKPPPTGVVMTTPPANLPHLSASTTQTEQVRQLVQCGGTMYAVGTFTTIRRGSTTYTRNNVFSFSATAPYTVTSWAPNVVGPYGTTKNGTDVVNTIGFANGDCSHAYIGGKFTSVNGMAVSNIAEISTTTGNVVSGFKSGASGTVQTIVAVDSHLLVGGNFTGVNGDTADPYMASLNPTTGLSDGFLHLKISGNYQYPGVSSNPTRVYNQQISHGGTLDLVEGDFTSVGGQARQQAFILNVGGTSATVTGWNAPEFNTNCYVTEPFYVRDGAWSPDDSTVYFGTTGFHPNNQSSPPWTGPCDAAIAFPSTATTVSARWHNYTGCDSLYSAAADSDAAYFAGHERWSMNPDGCNDEGPGAYPAQGLEGVDPANGALFLNPAGTAGLYTRDRGLGAVDMFTTSAGLWIASDNLDQSQFCGGVSTSGICFLPYA